MYCILSVVHFVLSTPRTGALFYGTCAVCAECHLYTSEQIVKLRSTKATRSFNAVHVHLMKM